jgi:hypothetical protein
VSPAAPQSKQPPIIAKEIEAENEEEANFMMSGVVTTIDDSLSWRVNESRFTANKALGRIERPIKCFRLGDKADSLSCPADVPPLKPITTDLSK